LAETAGSRESGLSTFRFWTQLAKGKRGAKHRALAVAAVGSLSS
jgi:hypothetical protein